MTPLVLPAWSPNLNAFAERFIGVRQVRVPTENNGGTFTRHNLTAAFTWLTKYSNKVSDGYWPFKDFKKDDGVWYFQMDPAMQRLTLAARRGVDVGAGVANTMSIDEYRAHVRQRRAARTRREIT